MEALLVIQPTVSKHSRKLKALTQVSGLASSVFHPLPILEGMVLLALCCQYHWARTMWLKNPDQPMTCGSTNYSNQHHHLVPIKQHQYLWLTGHGVYLTTTFITIY